MTHVWVRRVAHERGSGYQRAYARMDAIDCGLWNAGRHACRHAGSVRLPRFRRYAFAARWYDQLSAERTVYRRPRITGVAALDLRPGERVLDIACGTGLNMPWLVDLVGTSGEVVGVDTSATMLDRARSRISDAGWVNVTVLRGDAADLDTLLAEHETYDAVLFTYALSIIDRWQQAFDQAFRRLRPGGRVVVVDLGLPTGRWRWLTPLARLVCFSGGADPYRQPWTLVTHYLQGATHTVLRGGHVHCAAGQVAGRRSDATGREAKLSR